MPTRIGRSWAVGLAFPCVWLHLAVAAAQAPAGAVATSQEVEQLLNRGAYAQAEQQARRLCDAVELQYGRQSLELAAASDLLVTALVRNGKAGLPDTLTLAQHAVQSKEHLRGTRDLDVAFSLDN